jgi:N-acetylglucosamine repressor
VASTKFMQPARGRARAARPSTIREINRSIILNLVRLHQPLSRADLSGLSGIFRSNVSDIVERLIKQGLINEERAVPSGRGRVPFMLTLNAAGFGVLGVNVRASETTLALAGLTGGRVEHDTFATPERPAELVKKIAGFTRKWGQNMGPRLREIGISMPGWVNGRTGTLRWIPALPAYAGFALATAVEKATGVPTAVENDCNLGALAELVDSEAKGEHLRDFVLLDIGGVGVGAGIVVDGEIYRGYDTTVAAEFGHMMIDPGGPACPCGGKGCWELYVTSRATWKRYRPRIPFTRARFEELLVANDSEAQAALRETARYLAIGISNIAFALNPQVIVVAGRMAVAWKSIKAPLERALSVRRLAVPVRPASVDANELFLRGATQLALGKAFERPSVGW